MSDEYNDDEPMLHTLMMKVPFLFLGLAIGMISVWVAFQWVPGALINARAAFAG